MPVTSLAQNTTFYELNHLNELSLGTRSYFQERLKNRLYDLVLSKFHERVSSDNLTKAELARRTGHSPAVITRLLGAPGNWRLDTVSDLLLGIGGEELVASSSSPLDSAKRNYQADDHFSRLPPKQATTPPSRSEVEVNFVTLK